MKISMHPSYKQKMLWPLPSRDDLVPVVSLSDIQILLLKIKTSWPWCDSFSIDRMSESFMVMDVLRSVCNVSTQVAVFHIKECSRLSVPAFSQQMDIKHAGCVCLQNFSTVQKRLHTIYVLICLYVD